jgi:integrase
MMGNAKIKTVHNDIVAIRQLVNFAIRRGMIRTDPLAGLELSQPKPTPQPCWTRDQTENIVKATSPRYRALFQFLADTGTRIGEARWLTWDDVDLANKVVRIQSKEGWQPKTGDERVVHLSNDLWLMLSQLPRSSQWVFTAPRAKQHPEAGRQISDRRVLAHLKTVLKRLNLPGHLHTFRHAFISHAVMSGVPEAMVRDWVGHVDARTMKRYTHIADEQSRIVMDQILPGTVPSLGRDGADDVGSTCAQNVRRKEDGHE